MEIFMSGFLYTIYMYNTNSRAGFKYRIRLHKFTHLFFGAVLLSTWSQLVSIRTGFFARLLQRACIHYLGVKPLYSYDWFLFRYDSACLRWKMVAVFIAVVSSIHDITDAGASHTDWVLIEEALRSHFHTGQVHLKKDKMSTNCTI